MKIKDYRLDDTFPIAAAATATATWIGSIFAGAYFGGAIEHFKHPGDSSEPFIPESKFDDYNKRRGQSVGIAFAGAVVGIPLAALAGYAIPELGAQTTRAGAVACNALHWAGTKTGDLAISAYDIAKGRNRAENELEMR